MPRRLGPIKSRTEELCVVSAALISGVIMAIVFSAKINGNTLDPHSPNNYYTGMSKSTCFLRCGIPAQFSSSNRNAVLVRDRPPRNDALHIPACASHGIANSQVLPSSGEVSPSVFVTSSVVFPSVSRGQPPLWPMPPTPNYSSRF